MSVPESTEPAALHLPYLSFGSLTNFLDRLRTAGDVPGRIDRKFLGGSGAYQSQMLQALKFLGLVSDDLVPTDALRLLALADDEARKPVLAEIVRERYAALLALGESATQSQLEEEIRRHGLTGDTVRKAASLYLAAAKFAEVPISTWFKATRVTPSNGAKRKATAKKKVESGPLKDAKRVPPGPPAAPPGSAGSTTIRLASGGHLTFSYSVDLFSMSTDDRTFVFKLIDEMRAYEQAQPAPPDPVVGDDTDDLDPDEGD